METAPETHLRRDAAAEYLRQRCGLYTAGTLAKLAVTGDGPPKM